MSNEYKQDPCTGFFLKNSKYKEGEKQPYYKTHSDSPVEIKEPGFYDIAMWVPKPGKKAAYLRLTKVQRQEQPQQPFFSQPVQPVQQTNNQPEQETLPF